MRVRQRGRSPERFTVAGLLCFFAGAAAGGSGRSQSRMSDAARRRSTEFVVCFAGGPGRPQLRAIACFSGDPIRFDVTPYLRCG